MFQSDMKMSSEIAHSLDPEPGAGIGHFKIMHTGSLSFLTFASYCVDAQDKIEGTTLRTAIEEMAGPCEVRLRDMAR
jgi:hypothetical protein